MKRRAMMLGSSIQPAETAPRLTKAKPQRRQPVPEPA